MSDFQAQRSPNVLDVSWQTILKISFSIFCFYLIYLIRDVLVWSFLAFIISILFDPIIDFLHKLKIPRVLSVVFIYTMVFGSLSLLIYFSAPIFVSESQYFINSLPVYFEKIALPLRGLGFEAFNDLESFIGASADTITRMSDNIFKALFSVFGGIFSTIFTLTVATFFSLQEKEVEKFLILVAPKGKEHHFLSFWEKSQKKLSSWLLSILLSSFFVGVFSYLVFMLFETKYSLLLALFAGVLNIIPIVGPIVTGILILLLVSLDSAIKAIFAVTVFILIQQVENNILNPLLTKKIVGVAPAVVLISMSIGASLFGFVGALLAVPLAGILSDLIKEFLKRRKTARAEQEIRI